MQTTTKQPGLKQARKLATLAKQLLAAIEAGDLDRAHDLAWAAGRASEDTMERLQDAIG